MVSDMMLLQHAVHLDLVRIGDATFWRLVSMWDS